MPEVSIVFDVICWQFFSFLFRFYRMLDVITLNLTLQNVKTILVLSKCPSFISKVNEMRSMIAMEYLSFKISIEMLLKRGKNVMSKRWIFKNHLF